jgi:hypothetical protein
MALLLYVCIVSDCRTVFQYESLSETKYAFKFLLLSVLVPLQSIPVLAVMLVEPGGTDSS